MLETEKLLRDLVALPSVNPAFLPVGDARAGEQRVGDFLAARAARAGLDVEFRQVLPQRANFLASLSPRGRVKQRVLLAPHLDTAACMAAGLAIPRARSRPCLPRYAK
jgi:acetylornithine deacetylase/succinyl-diaminopimelate desuccinylase-like protein